MKKKMYCAFLLAMLTLPLNTAKVFADEGPPTLSHNGYRLRSKGSIVFQTQQMKEPVEFCSEDLYRIAEEINAVEKKIK